MANGRRSWKEILRKSLELSSTELNGLLLFLPLIMLLVFAQPLYRAFFDKPMPYTALQLDSLLSQLKPTKVEMIEVDAVPMSTSAPFNFNPNHVSRADLQLLGFENIIASRIVAYVNAGGKFRYKEDLYKIREIDSLKVLSLWYFIDLPEKPGAQFIIEENERRSEEKALLDLNMADTTQLKKIFGIGSVLSARIVNYRTKLGGFVHSKQLNEVYGLSEEVIDRINKQFFIAEDFIPLQININNADQSNLAAHPYLNHQQARTILAYRQQHGNFQSKEDLSKLYLINDTLLVKILPYISF